MPRCHDCQCELPGLESLCQECFKARQCALEHPRPWWQGIRPRLTFSSLYVFVFVFLYGSVIARIDRDHHRTITDVVCLSAILAAGLILIFIAMRKSKEPKLGWRGLYAFLFVFIYFVLRFWAFSTSPPFESPGLWAFAMATIAAVIEAFRANPGEKSQKKSAGENPRRV